MIQQIFLDGKFHSVYDDSEHAPSTIIQGLIESGTNGIFSTVEFCETDPVPPLITMYQAREACRRLPNPMGPGSLLDLIEAAVATRASSIPQLALAWGYAPNLERNDATINEFAAEFGLPPSIIDTIFRIGSTVA